jgi:hypothetical protein
LFEKLLIATTDFFLWNMANYLFKGGQKWERYEHKIEIALKENSNENNEMEQTG